MGKKKHVTFQKHCLTGKNESSFMILRSINSNKTRRHGDINANTIYTSPL